MSEQENRGRPNRSNNRFLAAPLAAWLALTASHQTVHANTLGNTNTQETPRAVSGYPVPGEVNIDVAATIQLRDISLYVQCSSLPRNYILHKPVVFGQAEIQESDIVDNITLDVMIDLNITNKLIALTDTNISNYLVDIYAPFSQDNPSSRSFSVELRRDLKNASDGSIIDSEDLGEVSFDC